MFKEKPFKQMQQKTGCANCGQVLPISEMLRYLSRFYCCLLCRGTAEYRDRVK